jgi:hypothetical protein
MAIFNSYVSHYQRVVTKTAQVIESRLCQGLPGPIRRIQGRLGAAQWPTVVTIVNSSVLWSLWASKCPLRSARKMSSESGSRIEKNICKNHQKITNIHKLILHVSLDSSFFFLDKCWYHRISEALPSVCLGARGLPTVNTWGYRPRGGLSGGWTSWSFFWLRHVETTSNSLDIDIDNYPIS